MRRVWIVGHDRRVAGAGPGCPSTVERVTVSLRVVLDQLVSPTSTDLADASRHLLAALAATTPSGCEVAGIIPGLRAEDMTDQDALADLADVWKAPVERRQLAAAWRVGTGLGAAGGMIHSPTLMAPLVRHDRAHDHDQTVVTVWGLDAWTAPERLERGDAAWQRAMLKRAVRFADAVVVPTHAMAAELAEIAALGARIRVIAGAASTGVRPTADGQASSRGLGLPERYIAVAGAALDLAAVFQAVAGLDIDVVVLGDGSDDPPRISALAIDKGISVDRVRSPHLPAASDRASVLTNAVAVVAPSGASVFPWRALEALAVGAPLVAARTAQNEEIFADGAFFVDVADSEALGDAVRRVISDEVLTARLKVLSADRARAFSWRDAAERVWQLHAEL